MMNSKQYLETQLTLVELGSRVAVLNLDDFLASISEAKTTAPFIDPTLYRRGIDNLEAIEKLARAFRTVQAAFYETRQTVIETAVRESTNGS